MTVKNLADINKQSQLPIDYFIFKLMSWCKSFKDFSVDGMAASSDVQHLTVASHLKCFNTSFTAGSFLTLVVVYLLYIF